MNIQQWKESIQQGVLDHQLTMLYGADESVKIQSVRYMDALNTFHQLFGDAQDVMIFTTPGRTEVGGNHTDHNAGRVLAASVNMDALAIVVATDDHSIEMKSEGYPMMKLDSRKTSKVEKEKYTTAALIRGVIAGLRDRGHTTGGFRAYVTSNVLKGSGLSSSAAFEVLVGSIENELYNAGRINPVEIAQIAQYAENEYFGKPSGLMDQMACSVGGFVTIDFKEAMHPVVEKVDFDFASSGLSMVITDTGGNHSQLNDDYAAIKHEMEAVAKSLGGQLLRDITLDQLMQEIPQLRSQVNDRAILRAVHFLQDNQRVVEQVNALNDNDVERFLDLVVASGNSSWKYLQNCYVNREPEEQSVTLALMLSQQILDGRGAWRVHGGGFAGTIQAFMPHELVDEYVEKLGRVYGQGACHILTIRPVGAYKVQC